LGFPLLGIGLAYTLYMRPRHRAQARLQRPILDGIRRWWFVGWGFDWLYGRLFVMPFLRIARANRDDAADLIYQGIAWLNVALHHALRATQSGRVRWYAAGIALGAAIILGIVVVT
jgi:NADH-quinone oxidoreductase subunit L